MAGVFIIHTPTDIITIRSHQEVYVRLVGASANWYNLGGALGLDVNTLNAINSTCRGVVLDCLREMIAVRLQSGDALTWRELCDCLKSPTVKRNDVAEEIERQIGELNYP